MDSYNEDKSLSEILREFGLGLFGVSVQWAGILHKYPNVAENIGNVFRTIVG